MILILTTGGTIASTGTATRYQPNQSGSALLTAFNKQYPKYALSDKDVEIVSPIQKDSKDLTLEDIEIIHKTLIEKLSQDDTSYQQVLVLCGTDNMETLVFSLHLNMMLQSFKKPIIVTGAMRPSSDPETDAYKNIHDAILWGQEIEAFKKKAEITLGNIVYAAFNGQLIPPYALVKKHTTGLATFDTKNNFGCFEQSSFKTFLKKIFKGGNLEQEKFKKYLEEKFGLFTVDQNAWQAIANLKIVRLEASIFSTDLSSQLEQYTKIHGINLEDFKGLDAVIIKGTGNGTYPATWDAKLLELKTQGVPIIRTSRCNDGAVDWQEGDEYIAAQNLSIDKLQLLLSLCLINPSIGKNYQKIQEIFNQYNI